MVGRHRVGLGHSSAPICALRAYIIGARRTSMTTRLRAGPFVAMIAIIAATALSPLNAAATPNQTAIIAYGTAPNFLVPEVTSSPTAAWMNVTDATAAAANVVFGTNYTAASVSTRAAPINSAAANMVTNFTDIENARAPAINQAATDANAYHSNLVLGAARAAPATNDMKIAAIGQINDAKKTAASYGAVDGA